jgi:hypothetical protein
MTETTHKNTNPENSKSLESKITNQANGQKVFRTKIFSLFLLALLIIPAVLVSPSRQNATVLGVSENVENAAIIPTGQIAESSPSQTSQAESGDFDITKLFEPEKEVSKIAKIGQIGSGAQEVQTLEKSEAKVLSGRVIWDENARSAIATDKFPLGSSIKVSYESKDVYLVVGDARVLSSDTVLVVNRDTFIKIGGDPTKENKINVQISLD